VPDAVEVTCPYCGEPGEVELTPDEEEADFVQDCAVCCRPWRVRIRPGRGGPPEVSVGTESD
jgi:hypothetical protein